MNAKRSSTPIVKKEELIALSLGELQANLLLGHRGGKLEYIRASSSMW
ncbi:MAG: hypothetical protein QXW62_03735 [Candidatus Methanomethylicaceae archaeon]|nr:hypothetical protein [Candidatus Verstraetearchaeota archaeon]